MKIHRTPQQKRFGMFNVSGDKPNFWLKSAESIISGDMVVSHGVSIDDLTPVEMMSIQ
jgi:hypothetical protein